MNEHLYFYSFSVTRHVTLGLPPQTTHFSGTFRSNLGGEAAMEQIIQDNGAAPYRNSLVFHALNTLPD